MRILTVDIGTGTQDIFLYDSRLDIENGFKLVVPSPTMMIYQKIKTATKRNESILLSGVTMGGGPSQWATEAHVRAGLPVFATPEAARSFNNDLEAVKEMGIQVVSEDEGMKLSPPITKLQLKDFDYATILRALEPFGISLLDLSAIAVAVFDHGNAPPNYSDRQFRFDYLDHRIRDKNRLSAFAYRSADVPDIMTRLLAVVRSYREETNLYLDGVPLVVMDTAPAAVLGATYDPNVGSHERVMIANVGNFHTLAFRLGSKGIEGVFEHHTGLIDLPKMERLLILLANGQLTHEQVFADNGHGALIYSSDAFPLTDDDYGVVVTGPRRNLMRGSNLRPYFAVPFGDMMLAGCYGLLSAVADLMPEFSETISASLRGTNGNGKAPWDL
jgi:uncharacterized protein (DUF1786 family)